MKKVTAFVGCGSRKHTYEAVRRFAERLQAQGDVEVEIVRLSEFRLETCRGCHMHIHLKDIETLRGDVSRLAQWVRLVREVAQEAGCAIM